MRFYGLFLICIFVIGCSALLTQHTFIDERYVRIDVPVTVTDMSDGIVCAIPEREFVRKIRILGEGEVKNIEVWARGDKDSWKRVGLINRRSASPLVLPIEINMHHLPLTFKIDTIRIVEKVGNTVQFQTVEFYKTVPKDQ